MAENDDNYIITSEEIFRVPHPKEIKENVNMSTIFG
jgi:hypothetical protein